MKYRLKKDLPFAKAGIEIRHRLETGVHPSLSKMSSSPINFWIVMEGSKEHWQQLISEGWIEEAKPREYNLWLDENGGAKIVAGQGGNRIPEYDPDIPIKEIIKVREVIE